MVTQAQALQGSKLFQARRKATREVKLPPRHLRPRTLAQDLANL